MKKGFSQLEQGIIDFRRELHRYPELSGKEVETARRIIDYLGPSRFELTTGIGGNGVKALLRGKKPGQTIALRADMDALPVEEKSDLPYRSRNPGIMHACGHDGHCAAVAGSARMLVDLLEDGVPEAGNVVFIFQPSEELPPGGAKFMIQEGVLEEPRVDRIIGLHNSPNFPSGMIIIPDGPVTAGSDLFELHITGPGGHGARPENSADTVIMACHFVVLLQSMVSRTFTPGQWPVISVGTITGGKRHNIIPNEVTVTGTVRSFKEDGKLVKEQMQDILDSLTKLFGGEYSISYQFGYPSTMNDSEFCDLVRKKGLESPYFQWVESNLDRAYVSEDFGYFSEAAPSCYFIFGVGKERGEAPGQLHSGGYVMDDSVLPHVSRLLAETALEYLKS